MESLLFEFHTARERFERLLCEMCKYSTRLRPGEDQAKYSNVVANIESNMRQLVELCESIESEYLEFKLRTLKEIESLSYSEKQFKQVRWMESPFDKYRQ